MASKSTKAELKAARENIKAKKFTETVKICKEILIGSPDNSTALVFMGVAADGLGDHENALEAYKKAVSVAEEDPLAWQGLCSFYEKHRPASMDDLTHVYEKLIHLNAGNEQKKAEVTVKLCLHLLTQDSYTEKTWQRVESLSQSLSDGGQKSKIEASMASFCLKATTGDDKAQRHLFDVCDKMWSCADFSKQRQNVWEAYASALFQREGDLAKVNAACAALFNSYPSSSLISGLNALIYCHLVLLGSADADKFKDSVDEKLLSPIMRIVYRSIVAGEQLPDTLSPVNLKKSVSTCESLVIAKQYAEKRLFKKAQDWLAAAERYINDIAPCLVQCRQPFMADIASCSIDVHFKQHNYVEVIGLCERHQVEGHKEQLILSLIETGSEEEAIKRLDINNAEDRPFIGYIHMKRAELKDVFSSKIPKREMANTMAALPFMKTSSWDSRPFVLEEKLNKEEASNQQLVEHIVSTRKRLGPGIERVVLRRDSPIEITKLLAECCGELPFSVQEAAKFIFSLWSVVQDEHRFMIHYMLNKKLELDMAYQVLKSALSSAKTISMPAAVHLWLGQLCLDIPSRQKEALGYLLQAAKSDPQNELTFLHLAYYYNSVGDKQKGMKCLKKSYSLSPVNDVVCNAYVDQLIALGDTQQAMDILIQTTKLSACGSCKGAWFRLGSLMSSKGDYTEAINCFQQALRADELDSNCWECLADCYVKRGSYTAAIGAFEKACQLNPAAVYSSYQIALTKHKLGLFTDAEQLLLDVLNRKPDYTPALKGLGDVYVSMAKDALKFSIYGKVAKCIVLAVRYLTRAAEKRKDLTCIWKSLGDALTLSCQLPAHMMVSCPSVLVDAKADRASVEDIDASLALEIGARCYRQCTYLREDNSSAWHDLAVNQLYQSKLSTDGDKRKSLLQAAAQYELKAISLDKQVAHYNCLGAIYMQPEMFDASLAQHYLILGIEMDQSNAQGWTNLAALYLMQDDIPLAHEALKIAQSADPKYNECWTGQAVVAETIGHDEAMDLFRHTTELGRNVESAIGYSHWVLNTLLEEREHDSDKFRYSIEKLDAVTVSCDSLAAFVGCRPEPQSLNAYALLLERQGLFKMAVKASQQCVSMATEVKDTNLSLYRSNLARLLCSVNDYQGCLLQLQELSSPSVHDVAVTALCHFKSAAYAESFHYYSKLSEMVECEEMKSHVYTAMGMLAVKCGDVDTAKTAFFKCSQSTSPSIYGLAGLCSLALLSGDGELALAALAELIKCTNNKEAYLLKCTFSSYMAALKGDRKCARNHLLQAIHCYPTDKQLHNQLLSLSLAYLPDNREAILRLSQGVSSVRDLLATTSLACGHIKRALKQSQAAVHLDPASSNNWALLLSTVYSSHKLGVVCPQLVSTLLKCTDVFASRDAFKDDVKRWLAELTVLFAAEHDAVSLNSLCQHHSQQLAQSSLVNKLNAFLTKDLNALMSADNDLLNLLLQLKLRGRESPQVASGLTHEQRKVLDILHAKTLLDKLMIENTEELRSEFLTLLKDHNSSSALFLLAVFHWKVLGKMRHAVRIFECVVRDDEGKETAQSSLAKAFLLENRL